MISLLRLEDVHAYYGQAHILKGVSLEIPEGQVVALLGANGAGKTTTLRTISGVVRPRSGQILFNGKPIHRLAPDEIPRLGIGHVPEGRGIFRELTVMQNLQLARGLQRDSRLFQQDLERILHLLPILKEKLTHPAGSLSGGQQQMLVISRALLTRPRLLMVDELSFGLAPVIVKELFDLLRQLNQEGMTVLLVEQNVGMALQIAHTAYVLATGLITVSGPAATLAHDQEVVRTYLGGQ